MDVSQALKDAENSLRDFIASVLSAKCGNEWEVQTGVSPERLAKWRERKEIEQKRQESGVVEERLLYYADFYDLKTILKKHWSGEFSQALGDWKAYEVWLAELERIRDSDAHRRELLPHQKHLALGIAGEIRSRIVRHRSRKETSADCFPRIESARDSLGNIWVPSNALKLVSTNMTLRVGDSVDYVITARDPEELPLEYAIAFHGYPEMWQELGVFQVALTDNHIGQNRTVKLFIRSRRAYHASTLWDDVVHFIYDILPNR